MGEHHPFMAVLLYWLARWIFAFCIIWSAWHHSLLALLIALVLYAGWAILAPSLLYIRQVKIEAEVHVNE